jgi:hypothetical protein
MGDNGWGMGDGRWGMGDGGWGMGDEEVSVFRVQGGGEMVDGR